MTAYTLGTTVPRPYDETVAEVRRALQVQGFGVLTEIDLAATLKEKLDVDVEPQVVLGACRPALAHRALQVDPSIAAVLPCNVVVRRLDHDHTRVEAFDPLVMTTLSEQGALGEVADEARDRLRSALDSLGSLDGR
jgi:uncharacterized protein (DUF302 family)